MFFAGAYWGPRPESAEVCAYKLANCLEGLSNAHPSLRTWFRTGRSKATARKGPIDIAAGELSRALKEGSNRRDADRSIIAELGFSLALWNGGEAPVGLAITCGAGSSVISEPNHLVLDLPDPDSNLSGCSLYEKDVAARMMKTMVEIWQPDYAIWSSYSIQTEQAETVDIPTAGWFTYVKPPWMLKRSTDAGVMTEEFAGGTLAILDVPPVKVASHEAASVRKMIYRSAE
ncbi:Imm52 family immunity protein [Microbispora sp. NPDC049125]|uniref:Imm52 family immunity protein n=1 Tax=Microbispora sp. NPDC049125 TaxID=3154929 RepID=UPI00346559D2